MNSEIIEPTSKSFFSHVTSFDKNQKSEFMNMVQYGFMALIPIVLINKGIGELFSDSTEDKTTIELSLEVIAQLFIMVSSIYLIHRIITYFPTYSETPYSNMDFIGTVFVFILIVFSFQTQINAKTQVVFNNLYSMVTGRTKQEEEKPSKKVSFVETPTVVVPPSPMVQPTKVNSPPDYLNQQSLQNATTQPIAQAAVENQMANNQLRQMNFDQFHEPMAANQLGGFSSF